MFTRKSIIAGVAAALIAPLSASAQFGRGGGGDQFGLTEIKTQIRSSDEEWKIIGPKLREVMTARSAVEAALAPDAGTTPNANVDGGPGSRGGLGGGMGNDPFGGPSDFSGGGGPGGRGRGGRGGPGGPGGDGFGPPNGGGDFGGPRGGRGFGGPRGPGGPDGDPNFQPPDFANGGRGGPGGGRGRGGGRGGPGGGFGGESNAVLTALTDLKTTLADTKSTPEEIQTKVVAVRAARSKAKAQLDAAQKDLLPLLTEDQQAVLMQLGYID